MTREEKIRGLYNLKEYLVENPIELDGYKSLPITLIDYAIETLEQEPCNDCISRDMALEKMADYVASGYADSAEDFEEYSKIICQLPPVTQQTRWIPVSERLPEEYKEVFVTDIETSDAYLSRYIGNGYWECDNGLFKNRIIAWQPLPQPYKAESEDKE